MGSGLSGRTPHLLRELLLLDGCPLLDAKSPAERHVPCAGPDAGTPPLREKNTSRQRSLPPNADAVEATYLRAASGRSLPYELPPEGNRAEIAPFNSNPHECKFFG